MPAAGRPAYAPTEIAMKNKRKITGLLVLILTICALVYLVSRITADNETLGDTGWTIEQFIKWAEKVQPVVGHRRWRYHPGGYVTISSEDEPPAEMNEPKTEELLHECVEQFLYDIPEWSLRPPQPSQISGGQVWKDPWKELMEPNEPFFVYPMVDADDIVWYGILYRYEWDFKLPAPYEKLPGPVRKVIDSVNQRDVGRFTGEILPYFARPVAICSMKKGRPVFSEDVEVKLLSLSSDKLEFTVETEPFVLSEDPDLTGKVHNKIVLYSPDGTRVGICRPKKFRKENR